jgi:Uma2 family endonuclease
MNIHVPKQRATTQAAEGMPRRAWTVAEIEQMVAAGILLEDERFELIGGEVVPMSPKGNHHEVLKKMLQQFWIPKIAGSLVDMATETTLHTSEKDFLEPDFVIWPRSIPIKDLKPAVLTLVVEIADSSLAYDLGTKAARYAALGIRDYWVIDAVKLATRIHRAPGAGGFANIDNFTASDLLTPAAHPDLAVRLAGLDLR